MLTLSHGRYCQVAGRLVLNGADVLEAGEAGQLAVLCIQQGSCSVAGAPGEANDDAPELDELALLYADGDDEEYTTGGMCPAHRGDTVLARAPLALAEAAGCRAHGVLLCGAAAEELAAQLEGPLVLSTPDDTGAAELVEQLATAPMSATEASAMAYALLCRLADTRHTAAHPPLVEAALQQIQAHYAEVYGVEELAAELEVSKSHLIRSFTAAIGTSPGRHLTLVRIENAKRLLLRGGYPLEVIASLCGFSGANYLCKVFKKETGQSPAAWRRQMQPQAMPAEADEWEQRMYL